MKNTYDLLTDFSGDLLYFRGPQAIAAYGGAVPLTTFGPNHAQSNSNFGHVGNREGTVGDDLIPDLMNGVVFRYTTRYVVSALDLAILADLGWTIPKLLEVQQLGPVSPNPRRTPVESVNVTFTQPLTPSTFTLADVTLKRDGTALAFNKKVKLTPGAGTYVISGLSKLTKAPGQYELTVDATGITSDTGRAGEGPQSLTWTVDKVKPTIVSVGPVDTSAPVDFIDFVTSEAIDLTTLDFKDVKLTRTGSKANLLLAGATITQLDETTYRIGNLTSLTAATGTYVLTVKGEGIKDLAGNLGFGSKKISWLETTF